MAHQVAVRDGEGGFRGELRALKTWRARLIVAAFGLALGLVYALIARL